MTLRAVTPDEKAPAKHTSVAAAVADGSQRDQLVTLRARIAKAIDEPNIRGADLAALSRRLLEIGREIEALDASAEQATAEGKATPDAKFDASAV